MSDERAQEAQPFQLDARYMIKVLQAKLSAQSERLNLAEAYLEQVMEELRVWQERYQVLESTHSACAVAADAVLIEPDTDS
jgi:hypothetical protein